MKRKFLARLEDELSLKYYQSDVESMIQEKAKNIFLKKLLEYKGRKREYESGEKKVEILVKSRIFSQLIGNVESFLNYREE